MSGRGWLAMIGMIALAVVAFGSSPMLFRDTASPNVSREAMRRLKTQHALGYDGIHPRYLQVTSARMTGPTPDDVEGSVVFRTLFGIRVGERYDLDYWRWVGAWVVLLSAESVLASILLREL